MSILKVARLGHPVLLQRAEPVAAGELASARIQRLIDDMIETMRDERGVGLAGPQVHESLRLFVMDPGDRDAEEQRTHVVVNPVLEFPTKNKVSLWEGCLSIPGIRGETERFEAVNVTCLDRDGKVREVEFRGFPAAVVQHETDHLDGILFLRRMPDLSRLAFEDEYLRFEIGDSEDDDEDFDDGIDEVPGALPGDPGRHGGVPPPR